MKYFLAPPGWESTSANPFSPDGKYGWDWSAFCLLDQENDQLYTGKCEGGPFSARFGLKVPFLQKRLADFLRYENATGRNVILSFPPGFNAEPYIENGLTNTPETYILRPEDPSVVVHSTSLNAWEHIHADGYLKAASLLPKHPDMNGTDFLSEVERYLQNEPPEYQDYIMFSEITSTTPERVAASYQTGSFASDETPYTPGIRLYFDNRHIIRDRLGVRDGLHTIKVYQELPLVPYLLAAIDVKDCDPSGEVDTWSPRSFVSVADKTFIKMCPTHAHSA